MPEASKTYANRSSIDSWKEDTRLSVEMYNDWFLNFAPATYIQKRRKATTDVGVAMDDSCFFGSRAKYLHSHPDFINILRMATTPPIARDRLVGFSGVSRSFLTSMEKGQTHIKMSEDRISEEIDKILYVIDKLLDKDVLPWLEEQRPPSAEELNVAKCIIADRLCGTMSDPIIRNEQEKRQLNAISGFLTSKGYVLANPRDITDFREMTPGSFAFHLNVPVKLKRFKSVNMPIDVVIKRKGNGEELPLFVECKSAGDFANTNKRRKEEAQKIEQLKSTYGKNVDFVLFLCGYFDSSYLGYEAAEGIDWVWEHRMEDFLKLGI